MSLAVDASLQTPQRGHSRPSSHQLEIISHSPSPNGTPESRGSTESRDDYGFWETPEKSSGNGSVPLTPLTPPDPPHYKDNSHRFLDIPASPLPHLRKSKSDGHLPISQSRPLELEAKNTDNDVRSGDNQPGPLFKTDFLKDPRKKAPLVYFNRSQDVRFDFDTNVGLDPFRDSRLKVPGKDDKNKVDGGFDQPLKFGFPKHGGRSSRLLPSFTEDSGQAAPVQNEKSKIKSETELTFENKTEVTNASIAREQKSSSIQLTHRQRGEVRGVVEKSTFDERLSIKTTVSSKSLVKILPFNTRERINERSDRCVASKTRYSDQRCTKKGNAPAGAVIHHLEVISGLDVSVEPKKVFKCIEELIGTAVCAWHRKSASTELEKWRARLPDSTIRLQEPTGSESTFQLTEFSIWINTLTTPAPRSIRFETSLESTFTGQSSTSGCNILTSTSASKTEVTSSAIIRGADSVTRTSTVHRTNHSKYELRQYIQNFERYWPKYRKGWDVQKTLFEAIIKPLTRREQILSGYIYVYWFPGNFGRVKIGKTKNVERRFKGWKAQCQHEAKGHYPKIHSLAKEIPNVYRVEALVHAELKDVRLKEIGCRCGKGHVEWFEVPVEHAVKVVKKWSEWICANPYTPRLVTKRVCKNGRYRQVNAKEWILNDESQENIETVCQPLQKVPVTWGEASSTLQQKQDDRDNLSQPQQGTRRKIQGPPRKALKGVRLDARKPGSLSRKH